jgi:hypothetical protein
MAGGAQQLPIHGSDHRPRGPDPIPGLAIYEIKVFEDLNAAVVGDKAFQWEIPEDLHNASLVKVEAFVTTVSSSGSVQLALRHLVAGVAPGTDVLSTPITIEAGDFNSKDAASQPVIADPDAAYAWGDHIAIDVDGAGVGAKGLGVIATFAPSYLASAILEGFQGPAGGVTTWTGAWSGATTYVTGQAVSNGGSSYVAIAGSTGVQPGVTPGWQTYWQLLSARQDTSQIVALFNGNGYPLTTGVKLFHPVEFNCTILAATLLADLAGSVVVDIWKDTYGNYPPTIADSICASAKPTLSGAIKTTDSSLVGWTTALAAGDTLHFNIESCVAISILSLSLKLQRT